MSATDRNVKIEQGKLEMKKYLSLATLACACSVSFSTPVVAASHVPACPNGSMVQSCLDHLRVGMANSQKAATCFKELDAEYRGWTGNGAGKGMMYRSKKLQCAAYAQWALDDILTAAPGPNDDPSASGALKQLITDLQADGIYELPTE